ncbi:hypothetical protein GMJLKIPL_6285 [Methylobacterium isbiliense]|uniref:Uncharacterized protein n=2 Tax=Methylobacterium isbiliense TaxID=315478 RepID=A0ABQ4SP87_9HYPH|nr:hypothetical protein GMJLKIPL_6285 [Methylobacterium isbiliense]
MMSPRKWSGCTLLLISAISCAFGLYRLSAAGHTASQWSHSSSVRRDVPPAPIDADAPPAPLASSSEPVSSNGPKVVAELPSRAPDKQAAEPAPRVAPPYASRYSASTKPAAEAPSDREDLASGGSREAACSADPSKCRDRLQTGIGEQPRRTYPISMAAERETTDENERKAIEQQLKSMNAQYKVPDQLMYRRSTQVVFVLEVEGKGTGARALAGVPGQQSAATVAASRFVRARLSGPPDMVKITLRGGEAAERQYAQLQNVEWT